MMSITGKKKGNQGVPFGCTLGINRVSIVDIILNFNSMTYHFMYTIFCIRKTKIQVCQPTSLNKFKVFTNTFHNILFGIAIKVIYFTFRSIKVG